MRYAPWQPAPFSRRQPLGRERGKSCLHLAPLVPAAHTHTPHRVCMHCLWAHMRCEPPRRSPMQLTSPRTTCSYTAQGTRVAPPALACCCRGHASTAIGPVRAVRDVCWARLVWVPVSTSCLRACAWALSPQGLLVLMCGISRQGPVLACGQHGALPVGISACI